MTTVPDTPAALLAELTARGIELQPHGDRLRFRPRKAMTPKLAEWIKMHKPEVLALLRGDRAQEPQQNGQNRPTPAAVSSVGREDRPEAPEQRDSCGAPRELSLAERVETGYVNPGWRPKDWADRLCQLADHCEVIHPGLAAQYRLWAVNVGKNGAPVDK